ncbi:MAG: 1-aminocyclopropane-1-carboxylate deaminase/D-cysteine desulfhydrase [Flavobacteriaceae bacterium]|nr:1-aminocyclopropane-1-carboxylate deaminase/D-cysteine desulfhydrase [Flavobacteriaceae bacterium]
MYFCAYNYNLIIDNFFSKSIISENQAVKLSALDKHSISLFIKREDKIHPFVSGNKFRKLKYNIFEAKTQHKNTLLTFGGAFSNHILATAVAGNLTGFKTIGVVRGEELGVDLPTTLSKNSTIKKAAEHGMEFYFVSRESYRQKSNANFIEKLRVKFGDFFLIPEGGTNALAVKGCEEILTKEDLEFNYICSAVGTGGTISGLINAAQPHQEVLGFPALKGSFLREEIQPFVKNNNWSLIEDYHFGGYAKYTDELIRFINNFKSKTSIQLDPIYTAKMLFGILDLAVKGYFKKGSKVLAIHTGGIQGIEGFNKNLIKKNKTPIKI